jgi:hypothetical protein
VAEIQVQRLAHVHKRLARASGWLAVAAAVIPLVVLGVFSRIGGTPILDAILEHGVLAALPFAALSYLAGRDLYGSAGSMRREGDEVVFTSPGSERRFPATAVLGGVIVPERNRVTVEVQLAGGDQLNVRVADLSAAEALLRELRVDVGNQRCRVQIADRTAARVVSLMAPLTIGYFAAIYSGMVFREQLSHLSGNLFLVVAVACYALLTTLIRTLIATPDVTVGTDGLAFRRGLRERFIPFTDLEDVRLDGLGLRILLRNRRRMLLFSMVGVSPARMDALKLRIREAIALRGAAPSLGLANLDRAGRSIAEWRAALAALARRGVDYRGAGLSAEDLEALLVSPDATAERRLAAAVALSASKHPGAPERIRIAAAQCASERLRIALEKLGEGEEDDAAIAEALEGEAAASSAHTDRRLSDRAAREAP